MSGTILLRRNGSTGVSPSVGSLQDGELAVNYFDGKIYMRKNNGTATVINVGGGLGVAPITGVKWSPVAGLSPIDANPNNFLVWLFSQGQAQSLTAAIRVPNSYTASNQINLRFGVSVALAAASTFFKMQTTAYLIRRNSDAVTSVANSYVSTAGDQAISSSVANQYIQYICDLTNASGQINSISVQPNDMLIVNLSRVATSGTDAAADLSFMPDTSEFIFG